MRIFRTKAYDNGWKSLIWIGNTVIIFGIIKGPIVSHYTNDDIVMFIIGGLALRTIGKIMNKRTAIKRNDFEMTDEW
jgi:hypothetical protein